MPVRCFDGLISNSKHEIIVYENIYERIRIYENSVNIKNKTIFFNLMTNNKKYFSSYLTNDKII